MKDSTADSAVAESSGNVDEKKLKQTTDMGFSRSNAVKELAECGGNVQNAITSLINNSTKN